MEFKRTTERLPTYSLVDESRVFGRKGDKEALVKLLLEQDDELAVVTIVGMRGMGTTTLAQLVYNDNEVKDCFEPKAWVNVSEEFDNIRKTKEILESVTSEPCNFKDLNLLQEKLKEKLSGKRFLIVLDDVWSEDFSLWEGFFRPFRTGVPGCKIIVTTRNNGVSVTMGAIPYRLEELSDDDSLSLLEKPSLVTGSFDDFPDLKEIGREIAKKCAGVPLAIKTVGRLLRTNQNRDEWEALSKQSHDEWKALLQTEYRIDINDVNNQIPPSPREDGWSRKVNWEWIFVIANFVLALPSAVFDQLSSVHKPQYALISMLLSLMAMLVCIVELIYKGRKKRVAWRWKDKIPDIIGLTSAISQFIVTSVNYSFAHRSADSPIKMSVGHIFFAFGLLCSKFFGKPNSSRLPLERDS